MSWPQIGPLMDGRKTGMLAFTGFPRPRGRRLADRPWERVNDGIKRRAHVVGMFTMTPRQRPSSGRLWYPGRCLGLGGRYFTANRMVYGGWNYTTQRHPVDARGMRGAVFPACREGNRQTRPSGPAALQRIRVTGSVR